MSRCQIIVERILKEITKVVFGETIANPALTVLDIEKFGKEGAFITKCTSQLMRDLGCIQSPQNAFILNLGLESLHVRMPKHVENGQAVAELFPLN